ncbi:unnamed protein product [Tuber melanosporum]|uniref:(Perigord truffle) hypothetical protein n=1 Tax=Tuber melanosporum (strain Mel28) TaxID=656061 RepID=D5GEA2_TUBMM|nr:uncharacterized protein GSTUM_00001196001 [Tuber melanosporum]CAZ82845.1 unnamed protein product [Tuber melanosporum]
MLHTTSPGSKPDRRASLSVATALSARNISGTSTLGNRANGHSRTVSDSREHLLHVRVHGISSPASPSLSALSSSPPPPRHSPKKPSSLPDSSNIQPGCFDTLSVDSASVASADSVGQTRVRRLCSPENSRRPFVPPPCRQTTNPRSSSQSKDLGGAYTGRLTEQALRDQEAVQHGDLDDTVPKTHLAPYQTITSTPQKPTSPGFGVDTIMASSTREGSGGNGLTSRDRSRSFASTHSDPTRKTEGVAESVVQGTVSKAFGSRLGRLPFGQRSNALGSMGNNEDNGHGEFSQPTVEGSKEKLKPTEGSVDSISGHRLISTSTTSNRGQPFRLITARAEGKARSAQEQSDGNGKQHLGSPSNAPRHGLSFTPAAGTRANSSPKDSKAPRQAVSTLPSPGPDGHLARRDKGHIIKSDVSPAAATQQSQKLSHKRNATTSSIHRTFSGEQGIGKARDERNRSSSAASFRGAATRSKPTSRSVSATSTVELGGSLGVAPTDALVTDANLVTPIPAEALETMRKESRSGRSSSTSSWTDVSEPGADFSSRKPAHDRQRNSRASSTSESTLDTGNYKDPNFEAHAQELSPEIDDADTKPAQTEFEGFAQSFLKRPSEADYEDLALASGAGNFQTSRYTPTPSPSKCRDTRRKTVKVPRGLEDIKLARKSPLEEEDSDVDSLQYLLENDQDFSALFPPVDGEEDDTALLLASLPTYKPPTAQKLKVRPRVEAEAGDQMWEQERAVHEKLMNRLRTLHLEVRSATRGLDVLEGFLDGAGSSGDLSECWDDAAQRKEYMRRLRKEEQKQRLILERRMRQRMALLGTPLPWSKWLVKWGFVAFLVVVVWYLLELAVL